MIWVDLVTLLALVQFFLFAAAVSRARVRYGVHAPATTGHATFERYFRILFQQSLRKQQLRFIESYCDSAEKRYQTFIQVYPGIEQYVPQKYIASYLGITPEFLSKIRRRLSQK